MEGRQVLCRKKRQIMMHHELCMEICSFNELELDELLIIAPDFRALFTAFSKRYMNMTCIVSFYISWSLTFTWNVLLLRDTTECVWISISTHYWILFWPFIFVWAFINSSAFPFLGFSFFFLATDEAVISTTLLGDPVLKLKKHSNKYTRSHARHVRWSLRITQHVLASGYHKQCSGMECVEHGTW